MKTITTEQLGSVTGGGAFNWQVSKSDAHYWGQMGAQVGGFVGGTIGAIGQADNRGPGFGGGALIGGGIGYAVGAGASLAHDAVVGSGKRPIMGGS
jgi:hypothetical protein